MKKHTIIIILLTLTGNLFSQQIKVTNDFGFWGGINIEKKLSKKFELNLEQQIRFYSEAKNRQEGSSYLCLLQERRQIFFGSK